MTDLWDRVDKAGDQLMDDKARLQAQLEAVRRERDEAQLYLTQERADKDRDVKKIKDLQTALTQLQALVRGPILTAARNYQVPCYCGDPNKPCENHDRHYVDRGVIAALDASLDPAPVEEQTETIKALRDERDRLREALEDIRDRIGNGALNVDWIKKCAAAALTPAAGGTRHG